MTNDLISWGRLRGVLDGCHDLPLSYGPIGIVRTASDFDRLDELAIAIGQGETDFERARTKPQPFQIDASSFQKILRD
jgi:hypothetical protein